MKITLRVAAVLSFLSFFCAGATLLHYCLGHEDAGDHMLAFLLGMFCVGIAFFAGPILLFAAERCGQRRKDEMETRER